jgi:hypothetical protein
MAKSEVATAWVLIREGRVAEWVNRSVLVFESLSDAKSFARRVIGRTPLRGQFTPHPLVGRLLAQVHGRPVALRRDQDDGTATYIALSHENSVTGTRR